MEKAAGAADKFGVRSKSVAGCCAVAVTCLLSPAIRAQDAGEVLVAQSRTDRPAKVQVRASSLPRFDAQDPAQRVDFSLVPLNRNGSSLGAVLGMASPSAGVQPMGLQPRAGVDLGVRWSQRLQSLRQIDVTAWRRLSNPDDAYSLIQMRQPLYGARVEMNLKNARGPLAFEPGFVGLQLEGGARITIKRKEGVPMVYYRSNF